VVQFTRPFLELLNMPRLDGDVNVIGMIIAIDGVLVDQRLGEIQCLDGQIEQAPCVIAADFGGQRLLTRGEAKNGLPAAAARGSEPHGARLEQGDPIAALRQVQRSRAPGDAAAQDHHVGSNGAAQRFAVGLGAAGVEARRGAGRGRVVGGGGWVGQSQDSSQLFGVFKILWLLTGLGACEPTGLFAHVALLLQCTKRC
jgi:hypothetical protein